MMGVPDVKLIVHRGQVSGLYQRSLGKRKIGREKEGRGGGEGFEHQGICTFRLFMPRRGKSREE